MSQFPPIQPVFRRVEGKCDHCGSDDCKSLVGITKMTGIPEDDADAIRQHGVSFETPWGMLLTSLRAHDPRIGKEVLVELYLREVRIEWCGNQFKAFATANVGNECFSSSAPGMYSDETDGD